MCNVTTPVAPTIPATPNYAKAKEPDSALLYREALQRAQMDGGGASRSTILTGLKGLAKPTAMASQTGGRTVLG